MEREARPENNFCECKSKSHCLTIYNCPCERNCSLNCSYGGECIKFKDPDEYWPSWEYVEWRQRNVCDSIPLSLTISHCNHIVFFAVTCDRVRIFWQTIVVVDTQVVNGIMGLGWIDGNRRFPRFNPDGSPISK